MHTPGVKIVVGTKLQERIARKLLAHPALAKVELVSLDRYYRFGLTLDDLPRVHTLGSSSPRPWYDRSTTMKLASLTEFLLRLAWQTRDARLVLFFVDTGVLERAAIMALRLLRRPTAVLQDAMKRRPRDARPGALTWFGGGRADLYMLSGEVTRDMVVSGEVAVVGSPLGGWRWSPMPQGQRILVANQCFARYGETSLEYEVAFVREVVERAARHAPVELRLHPHNDYDAYADLQSERVTLTWKTPMEDSLRQAGLVLTVSSTVILEALAAGRAVATLDWNESPYELSLQCVHRCANIDALETLLTRWSSDQLPPPDAEDVRAELTRYVAHSGEEAVEAIVTALERFLR